jgi:hypothetical protein
LQRFRLCGIRRTHNGAPARGGPGPEVSCLDAVNLILVGAPRGAFSFTFSNGETGTVLQLAQRLLRTDEASGAPGASTRRAIPCVRPRRDRRCCHRRHGGCSRRRVDQGRFVPPLCPRWLQNAAARCYTKSARAHRQMAARQARLPSSAVRRRRQRPHAGRE